MRSSEVPYPVVHPSVVDPLLRDIGEKPHQGLQFPTWRSFERQRLRLSESSGRRTRARRGPPGSGGGRPHGRRGSGTARQPSTRCWPTAGSSSRWCRCPTVASCAATAGAASARRRGARSSSGASTRRRRRRSTSPTAPSTVHDAAGDRGARSAAVDRAGGGGPGSSSRCSERSATVCGPPPSAAAGAATRATSRLDDLGDAAGADGRPPADGAAAIEGRRAHRDASPTWCRRRSFGAADGIISTWPFSQP